MAVMALVHLQKCFPFHVFLKKGGVLESYVIHRYKSLNIGQVQFRVKSANYYESYGPFFNFIFCKMPA